ERGKRVFPESDKAHDVVKALEKQLRDKKVKVMLESRVDKIVSKDNKIESVLLFLINFIFVMLSSYTTQILILVLGIIVITSLVKIKNIKKVALIFTVLCLILLIFKNSIGDVIVTIFEKNVLPIHPDISMRMIEIGNVLKGNLGDTIDIQSRFSLSQMSINSFLKSPLFGIEFANYNTSVLNIGGHSEWFDDLGRYGAFGFSLISLILAKTKNIFYISKNRNYFLIFIVFFIVYGLFNPVIDGSIVAVFCIVVPNFDSVIFPFLYKKGNKV
ncbi:MAG: NAD(P)/FAD-dependent oxidoreductase, partial [Bacilli bacterium]